VVPITRDQTMLDWMVGLGWPVVLVGGSYLGTISHTLTAAAVLGRAGLRFSVVISESEPPAPDFSETVARIAARIVQPVIGLPRGGSISRTMLTCLARSGAGGSIPLEGR
jgi:Dethiobiotin synthetase